MRNLQILLFWLLCAESYAQMEVSAGAGIGWFRMRDLREFQKEIRSSYPVDAKITVAFPAYAIYELEIAWKVNSKDLLGLYYQYGSTGGRVHYEDFSGEVYSDQLLHYNTLGLSVRQESEIAKNLQFHFDLHPGATFTRLEITEGSRIGEQRYGKSYKFHSINASLQPTVGLQKIWGQFGLKAYVGFHVAAYAGKLKFHENKKSYLTGGGNDPIVANWNGFRLGFAANYRMRGKELTKVD